MDRDVYSGRLKLNGEEHGDTLRAANNYAVVPFSLSASKKPSRCCAKRFPWRDAFLARDKDRLTLKMRSIYAMALYEDPGATLDDLREAVTTLEDTERTARRVLGGAHPATADCVPCDARVASSPSARETPPTSNAA